MIQIKILLLGGTYDARKIAKKLIAQGFELIYSVAGLVRQPDLDCPVISGGFSVRAGLVNYLSQEKITLVIDATHPYAQKMTASASEACRLLSLPCVRFDRAAWQMTAADNWLSVYSWSQLITLCHRFNRPFLTTGQLTQEHLDAIVAKSEQVIYRTAARSTAKFSAKVHWLKAIGPFTLDRELALMKEWQPDVLVSKNAGGKSTYAKLVAASTLKIPVIMLQRTELEAQVLKNLQVIDQIDQVIEYVTQQVC